MKHMNLQERKEEHIEKIRSIKSETVLEEMLYAMRSLEQDKEYIHLTPKQELAVNESMAQYKSGVFITHEDLEAKVDNLLV
jgi:predicted transcriptional regulator